MTKGEARAARKAAGHGGRVIETENGRLVVVRERTAAEERKHELGMYRWARRYDWLNGTPEGDGDR